MMVFLVMVFLWWCFCGGVFCDGVFCDGGGVFVVVFLQRLSSNIAQSSTEVMAVSSNIAQSFCGGVCVVVWWCFGGVLVVFLWWCFCKDCHQTSPKVQLK